MVRIPWTFGVFREVGRLGGLAAVFLCLGLSGCCEKCNLRGENFAENSLADQCRSYRTADRNNELFGLSNKAQQIEKDVGVQ